MVDIKRYKQKMDDELMSKVPSTSKALGSESFFFFFFLLGVGAATAKMLTSHFPNKISLDPGMLPILLPTRQQDRQHPVTTAVCIGHQPRRTHV